jgi:hypothetical protein
MNQLNANREYAARPAAGGSRVAVCRGSLFRRCYAGRPSAAGGRFGNALGGAVRSGVRGLLSRAEPVGIGQVPYGGSPWHSVAFLISSLSECFAVAIAHRQL